MILNPEDILEMCNYQIDFDTAIIISENNMVDFSKKVKPIITDYIRNFKKDHEKIQHYGLKTLMDEQYDRKDIW